MVSRFSQFIFAQLRPQRTVICLIIVLLLADTAVALALPYVIGQASGQFLHDESNSLWVQSVPFELLIGAVLMLFIAQAGLRFWSTYRVNLLGATILKDLSCTLYEHLQRLPVSFFETRRKGDVLSLLSHDISQLSYFMSGVMSSLIPSVLLSLGAVFMMAQLNFTLALLVVFCVPCFFILLKFIGRKIQPLSSDIMQHQAKSLAVASETVHSINTVKAFQRESLSAKAYAKHVDDTFVSRRQQLWAQALISPLMQLLITVGIVGFVVLSAMQYQQGHLTVAELVTLLLYGLLFARPMSSLAGVYGQWQQAKGAAVRVLDVLDTEIERDGSDARPFVLQKGAISLHNIGFAYVSTEPVLSNVNVKFEAGTVNVIQGQNGAGKSTLLHLLMRFYQPAKGHIVVDGQDLTGVTVASYRKHVALVSQETVLSFGTIAENIAYGMPNADYTLVKDAAKKAGAHQFIASLADGYNTVIGENGILLSGGQRQRLALARALLMDAQIVLFDEPTAASDVAAVAYFQDELLAHLAGKTIIVVTHDPRLQHVADQCWLIRNGELLPSLESAKIEQGV